MKLFHKRPLSLILCIMLGGFTVFVIGSTVLKATVAVIAITAFLLTFFLKNIDKRHKILTRTAALLLVACALLSYLYFNSYFIYDDYEGEVCLVGEVTDQSFSDFNKQADLKVKSINGKPVRTRKIRVQFDDEELYELNVGDTISFCATLSQFGSYNGELDVNSYYASRGYSAMAADAHSVTVTEEDTPGLTYKLAAYRKAITERIISHSNESAGGLLAALLLGERDRLSPSVSLDFSRIGITHILALSGMHLVILGFAVEKLLSLFKLNKKWQKLGNATFALLYMAFTGFPVSVVRAGIMAIIASLLFILASERDSVTNLFISVSAICIIQPYSVLDLSLWLSALATLGVILVAELNEQKRLESGKLQKGILTYIKNSILISCFAIAATFAITVSSFSGLSLFSPFATLIFSLLTELYMYAGLIFIAVCEFIPMGRIMVLFGEAIADLAAWLSSFDLFFASTDFAYIKAAAAVFSLLFFAFAIFDIKRKRTAATVLSALLLVIMAAATVSTSINECKTVFKYLRNESDEVLLISSDKETALIDVTTVNSSDTYKNLSYIEDLKITNLEKYVYTSYSPSICSSAKTLLRKMSVKEVYAPKPTNSEEKLLAARLTELFSEYRAELIFYAQDEIILNGEFSIFPQLYVSEPNKKIALAILYEDDFYTYLSSGALTGESGYAATRLIDGCHTLILGKRGRAYDDYRFIYELEKLERLIISSGGVILPQSTVEYYKDCELEYAPTEVDLIH